VPSRWRRSGASTIPSSEIPSLSRMVVADPWSVTPSPARRWTRRGVDTIGATASGSVDAQMRNRFAALTSVSTCATVADSIAIDFPCDVAFAIVVIYGRVNSTALIERTDQRLVADRLVGPGNATRFRCTNAMFGSICRCCGAIVHHVAAVILFQSAVSKADGVSKRTNLD
jgi:hypothetical protein